MRITVETKAIIHRNRTDQQALTNQAITEFILVYLHVHNHSGVRAGIFAQFIDNKTQATPLDKGNQNINPIRRGNLFF